MGELLPVGLPVAQSCMVIVSRVFVAEPAVIEQEKIHAEFLGTVKEADDLFFREVESRGFPVIEQGKPGLFPVQDTIFARPVIKIPGGLPLTLIAVRENKGRGRKILSRLQDVL